MTQHEANVLEDLAIELYWVARERTPGHPVKLPPGSELHDLAVASEARLLINEMVKAAAKCLDNPDPPGSLPTSEK